MTMDELLEKWRSDANAMDEIADEDCNDGEEAKECIERAKTLRDCASDLECFLAGRAAGAVGRTTRRAEKGANDKALRRGEEKP